MVVAHSTCYYYGKVTWDVHVWLRWPWRYEPFFTTSKPAFTPGVLADKFQPITTAGRVLFWERHAWVCGMFVRLSVKQNDRLTSTKDHNMPVVSRTADFYSAMLCIAWTMLSQNVCPSVRQSVTRRYFIKTAKHILKLFWPLGSHTILIFFHTKSYYNSPTWTP